MPNQKPTYQELEQELQALKIELDAQKTATREPRRQRLRFGVHATNFFLGSQISSEFKNIKTRLEN